MTNLLQDAVIDINSFQKHVETLTASQKCFIDLLGNWFENKRNLFVLVSGGPGSGKTHTVVKTLQWIKAEKVFMAPTARLANKINGQTIHSKMKLNWKPGSTLKNLEDSLINIIDVEECIKKSEVLYYEMVDPPKSVEIVVIDEVGMIPFWLLFRIVEKFFLIKNASVLVVCMGDSCQLKPVTSQYNVFQVPFDPYYETFKIEMQESKRFTPEYKLIIDKLRLLMTDLDEEKIFDFVRENFPVVEDLDEDLILKANRVLAYTNLTVQSCNEIYLNKIMEKYKLYKLYECKKQKLNWENPTCLRKNCTVVVTENGCGSVSNGTCLTFITYDKYQDVAICSDEFGNQRNISRSDNTGKIPLTLGFAVTIHKFQGETIDEDQIIFNFDGCKDLHLIYTALSRVRNMSQILAVVL